MDAGDLDKDGELAQRMNAELAGGVGLLALLLATFGIGSIIGLAYPIVLFVLFTFTVLIGTVFPLIVEAARGVQMSLTNTEGDPCR